MRKESMVLVGRGEPGVCYTQDPRSPRPPVFFSNIAIWIDQTLFSELQAFEKPIDEELTEQGPGVLEAAKAEIANVLKTTEPYSEDAQAKIKATTIGKIIETRMAMKKIQGGLPIWQFDGIVSRNPMAKDIKYMHCGAILGERYLTEWSWFDYNVKYLYYGVVAKLRNIYAKYVLYRNWEPGQFPVPFAKKGQYPIPQVAPGTAASELQEKILGLQNEIENKNETQS